MNRPMVDDNGIIRPMTDAEIAAMERETAQLPPPEPTIAEQVAELKTENAYLRESLELILSGVTEVGEND